MNRFVETLRLAVEPAVPPPVPRRRGGARRALALSLWFAAGSPGIPLALSQSATCTLTPGAAIVTPGSFGTASAGGFLPEIPQSMTIFTAGSCGDLTAAALPNSSSSGWGCEGQFIAESYTGAPWLAANVGGNTLTFTALSNASTLTRTGVIAISSSTGATASVSVTEAPDSETLVQREVRLLYQAVFGRDPDAGGFAFWTGAGGAGLGQMADSFLTSTEAFDSDFAVMAAYQAAIGAPPTYAQFTTSVAAIRSGAQTIPGLYLSLAGPNTTATASTVTSLYLNLLNRAPLPSETVLAEANGLAATFSILTGFPAGTSSIAPIGAVANEFQSTGAFHVDHTNGLYVTMLYLVILGRDPDPGGLQYWLGVANTGGPGILFQGPSGYRTRLQILGPGTPGQGFIGSPEFSGPLCPLE